MDWQHLISMSCRPHPSLSLFDQERLLCFFVLVSQPAKSAEGTEPVTGNGKGSDDVQKLNYLFGAELVLNLQQHLEPSLSAVSLFILLFDGSLEGCYLLLQGVNGCLLWTIKST